MKVSRKGSPAPAKGGAVKTRRPDTIPTARSKPVNQKDPKMKAQTNDAQEPAAVAAGVTDDASVDKIRDILFGAQIRDYEKKLGRLEEKLLKETTDLKDDVQKGLGAFDVFVKHELEAISDRLKSEHEERTEAIRDLAKELKDLKQTFQQKTAQLDDHLASNQRELRQQMLDQYRKLTDEIRQKSEGAAAALKREADELRFEKADRAALAALFTEVALRLRGEFKIPGAEHAKNEVIPTKTLRARTRSSGVLLPAGTARPRAV